MGYKIQSVSVDMFDHMVHDSLQLQSVVKILLKEHARNCNKKNVYHMQ